MNEYTGPERVKYLFIDGGCLRATLASLGERYSCDLPIELNYQALANGYSKTFFYDAVPIKEAHEDQSAFDARTADQRALLDHLNSLDRYHVYEGDARKRRSKGGLEQKKVDILIAVDMLTHTFRRNMHEATLLTGDVDFKPLIDALVREGMFVNLWYPPRHTSKELMSAADARIPLNIHALYELTTQRFRQQVTLPSHQVGFFPLHDDKPYFEWSDERWGNCFLCRRDEFYKLVAMPPTGRHILVEHRDMNILKLYCEDVFSLAIPPT